MLAVKCVLSGKHVGTIILYNVCLFNWSLRLFVCACGVTAWAGRFRRVGDLSKFDQLWLQLRGWILVYFILLHLCLPLVGYHYLLVGQGTGEHHNDISPI